MSRHVTGHTGLLCLLGSPVAHSISPEMHNEACRILDLDYTYLAFDVGTETLETAVNGLKAMGVRGFNLTMPDKNKMAELCDELSPAAKIGGAVNTVVNDNGKLTGHTTDGVGYMMAAPERRSWCRRPWTAWLQSMSSTRRTLSGPEWRRSWTS